MSTVFPHSRAGDKQDLPAAVKHQGLRGCILLVVERTRKDVSNGKGDVEGVGMAEPVAFANAVDMC
jgi:hypothetical protein